jgi:hypothetical protein
VKLKRKLYRQIVIFYFAIGLAGAVHIAILYAGSYGGDFLAFHTGWSLLWEGKGEELYDLKVQAEHQQRVLGGRSLGSGIDVLPYLNPPYSTPLCAPLAAFSANTAFLLWRLLELIVLGLILRSGAKLTSGWTKHERILALASFLALPQLQYAVGSGAFTLIVLLGFIKSWQSKHKGSWLSIAAVRPHFVIPVCLLFAITRWKVLVTFVAVMLVLSAVATYFCGWYVWTDYFHLISQVGSSQNAGVFPDYMINSRRLVGTRIAYLVWPLAVLSIPFIGQGSDFSVRFNHAILVGLFFSPHTNAQELLCAALPALLLYDYLRRSDLPRKVYSIILLATPITLSLTGAGISYQAGTLLAGLLLPALLLFNLSIMISKQVQVPSSVDCVA